MPNKQNLSMPGPSFERDKNSGWIKNNYHRIIPVLVIALAIAGALYFYNSLQNRATLLKPAIDQIAAQSKIAATPKANPIIAGASSSAPTTEKSGDKIIAAAAKGNGATHLARQALKEYLKDKPELAQKLGAEQRIYIEDYLRKHAAGQPKTLRIGDQLTFSNDNIQSAIDKALSLSDSQIKRLGQYVPLVPSLMTP